MTEQSSSYDITVSTVSPEALDRALARLAGVEQRRRHLGHACVWGWLVVWVAAMIAGYTHFPDAGPGWAIVSLALTAAPAVGAWIRSNRKDQAAARLVAASGAMRGAGALLDAIAFGNRATLTEVRAALQTLLPVMTRDNAAALSIEQRNRIVTMMFQGDASYMISMLQALERIGDAHALPYVSALARGKAIPNAARNQAPEITAAASRCVAAIQAHIGMVTTAGTLLRGSQRPAAGETVLLRPSDGTTSHAPHELLRADPEPPGTGEPEPTRNT